MGASPNLSKSSKSTGIGKSNAVLVVFQVLADNKIRGSGAFPALFNESMEVGFVSAVPEDSFVRHISICL